MRLTIINKSPSEFAIGDATGYSSFTARVPANDELTVPVDARIAQDLEVVLAKNKAAGTIDYSFDNDGESQTDDRKYSIFVANAHDALSFVTPTQDFVQVGPAVGGPAAAVIDLTLPAPGTVRDGKNVFVQDGAPVGSTSAIRVLSGNYGFTSATDLTALLEEGDTIIITEDAAGTVRNGSYTFYKASGSGPYTYRLLSALAGANGVSAAATLSIVDTDGVIKMAPTVVTIVTARPYKINGTINPFELAAADYVGGMFALQPDENWLGTVTSGDPLTAAPFAPGPTFAAPPPIGGGTPNTIDGTDITGDTLTSNGAVTGLTAEFGTQSLTGDAGVGGTPGEAKIGFGSFSSYGGLRINDGNNNKIDLLALSTGPSYCAMALGSVTLAPGASLDINTGGASGTLQVGHTASGSVLTVGFAPTAALGAFVQDSFTAFAVANGANVIGVTSPALNTIRLNNGFASPRHLTVFVILS